MPSQSESMIFLGGTNHTSLSSYLRHHHAIKSFLYSYFNLKVRMILINPDKKKKLILIQILINVKNNYAFAAIKAIEFDCQVM